MHTQFRTQDLSPAARCAASTRDGFPCQAAPLAHSPFCAFHDPRHHDAIAAGRARGGAAPRRRVRRLPRRLDYLQIADLTGELFVEALNHADPADPRSLRAIGQLARILLQAVGRPKDGYVEPGDGAEPAADAPHLLRVYPPASLAMETLVAATGEEYFAPMEEYFAPGGDDCFAPAPHALASSDPGRPCRSPAPEFAPHVDYHFQPDPSAEQCEEPTAIRLASGDATVADPPAVPPADAPAPDSVPTGAFASATPPTACPDLAPRPDPLVELHPEPCVPQRPEQGAGQGMDREWTGQLAMGNTAATDQLPEPAPSPADLASVPAAGPAFALPRSLVYIRPRPRDPFG